MPLTAKERRALLAASHPLHPAVMVSPENLGAPVLTQIRSAFAGRTLIKVRINADNAATGDATAAELARLVPCELVKRIGRVAVLHRPAAPET
jgi:RNA-binding protein YhbY